MDLVLVHGMGRTPVSMLRLSRHLRQAGHRPVLFGYSQTFESLERVTARLVERIERRVDTAPYALVGHSLGTVIIRSALGRLESRAPAACVFLAPPMRACKAAKWFSRLPPYRWVMGEMGQLLAQDAFMQALPMPAAPTRIYAGIAGLRASWLPFGMESNDGILSVAEATGDFAALAVQVPACHSFIMNSRPMREDMIRFLAACAPATRGNR